MLGMTSSFNRTARLTMDYLHTEGINARTILGLFQPIPPTGGGGKRTPMHFLKILIADCVFGMF